MRRRTAMLGSAWCSAQVSHTMIVSRTETERATRSGKAAVLAAADWLCLAASPAFAIMAFTTAAVGGGPPDLLCAVQDSSRLGGMVPMYLLMSAFHLPPWLRLVSKRREISAAKKLAREKNVA
jgi:hypothetical protein